MHTTSFLGKVHHMPSKYDPETRAKAVRLVLEHRDDYAIEWAAITAVSKRLGMNAETLRNWIRQKGRHRSVCQRRARDRRSTGRGWRRGGPTRRCPPASSPSDANKPATASSTSGHGRLRAPRAADRLRCRASCGYASPPTNGFRVWDFGPYPRARYRDCIEKRCRPAGRPPCRS